MDDCLFCKISRGEIPCRKVYEDEEVLAFYDIRPAARVHFLIIPKLHIESMLSVEPAHAALMGKLMTLVPQLAREQGLGEGFKVNINTGRAGGQEVFHLHLHVFGGGPAAA